MESSASDSLQAQADKTQRSMSASKRLAEYWRVREETSPVEIETLLGQWRLMIDRVQSDAAVWAPQSAAVAVKQTEAAAHEAVEILRALAPTLSRKYTSEIIDTRSMFVERRISSAFREIPGGQILGPTRDYTQRLMNELMAHEDAREQRELFDRISKELFREPTEPGEFPKVIDLLRTEGLIAPVEDGLPKRVQDVTREPLSFPAPRSAALQVLSRAETGALTAFAYSAMRGQGGDHPTIGELRYGRVPLKVRDPRGRIRTLGRLPVTESENISKIKASRRGGVPYMSLGYGLCMGHNESKAICMGIVDRSMRIPGDGAPAVSQEYSLLHLNGTDSHGAVMGLKLQDAAQDTSHMHYVREAKDRFAKKLKALNKQKAQTKT